MKTLATILVLICGGMLIYFTADFPAWGDPKSPASTHVSDYYIEHSLDDTTVPNIVTAVLADYRGYDTMFETIVVFAAGIACFFLLRRRNSRAPESYLFRHLPTGVTFRIETGGKLPRASAEFERIDSVWIPYDLITKTTCRIVIPFIQLFALYVVAHGHHSPGGGFQGGVIFGAALILFALSHNLRSTLDRLSERTCALLSSTGVLIYVGVGVLCLFLGAGFLNYRALAPVLGVSAESARSHGIFLVEIGVALAVMAVMISIYYYLASRGRNDEGL